MTRQDYWNRFNARQRAIEKKFIGSVYQAVRAQYISFLNAVRSQGYSNAKRNINSIVRPDGMVKVLKRMYRYAAHVEGKYVGSSLIKEYNRRKGVEIDLTFKRISSGDASFGIGFDEIADVVDEYFRIYQLNISGLPITETTIRNIEDHLFDQVEKGIPLDEAIKNFREYALTGGNNISRIRAKLIMQTESTRVMSFGGLIGAYKSGVDVDKQWVTCNDERVRRAGVHGSEFDHTVLDGQQASLFGSFYNGENIKFPGDPEASIENTANCRCTQFFKEKKRPKPRVQGRTLQKFLIDFFTGFFAGTNILESILSTEE